LSKYFEIIVATFVVFVFVIILQLMILSNRSIYIKELEIVIADRDITIEGREKDIIVHKDREEGRRWSHRVCENGHWQWTSTVTAVIHLDKERGVECSDETQGPLKRSKYL